MASYYCLQWWDEPLYPNKRDVLAEICKLINSDSSSTYGSGWGRPWEVLGAGEIAQDIEEALPLKFSLPFASGTLDIGKANMQARRIRRADADMLPSGWTLVGPLDVAIPAEMDLSWGGNATDEQMASKPLAFYFQGAAEEDLGNRAGCHFTGELEKALEDYYGIDRFTLYQGSSQAALSAPAYTWNLTAYTDQFGDMWLALTPFRAANRHVRAGEDDIVGSFAVTVPDIISSEWNEWGIDDYYTPNQMPLGLALAAVVFETPDVNDLNQREAMRDVCDVMCGYYGLTPDEFWNGPSNKCFAKMSRKINLAVHSSGDITCSLL